MVQESNVCLQEGGSMTCFNCAWFPDENTPRELCEKCEYCLNLMIIQGIITPKEAIGFVALAMVKK